MDKTRCNIDFLIFGGENAFYADEVKKSGSRIFKMDSIRKSGISGFCKSIEKCICENGPYDVVHSHIDYLSGYVLKVAKKCNVRIRLAHSHSTSAYTSKGYISGILMLYIRKMINRYATGLLACSAESAEYMFGSESVQKTVVVNNAIDLSRFCDNGQYNESDFDFYSTEKKIILHIGRFVEPKNHETLLVIFQEYLSKYNDAILFWLIFNHNFGVTKI